jgi:hypothetical protein
MAVNNLANFMAAVNATVGAKTGISYYCTITASELNSGSNARVTLNIQNLANPGVVLYKIAYIPFGQPGIVANAANTTGAAVLIGGANDGVNDSLRFQDAQVWLNWLAAQ